MFTACSMASAVEALGMTHPGTAAHAAVTRSNDVTDQKKQDCIDTVHTLFGMLRQGLKVSNAVLLSALLKECAGRIVERVCWREKTAGCYSSTTAANYTEASRHVVLFRLALC